MQLVKNPTDEKILELISISSEKATKWVKDTHTSDIYYWPAELMFHRDAAKKLGIIDYEKGIATVD